MDEMSLNRLALIVKAFSFRIRLLQDNCSHLADTEESIKGSMRWEGGNSSKAVKWGKVQIFWLGQSFTSCLSSVIAVRESQTGELWKNQNFASDLFGPEFHFTRAICGRRALNLTYIRLNICPINIFKVSYCFSLCHLYSNIFCYPI